MDPKRQRVSTTTSMDDTVEYEPHTHHPELLSFVDTDLHNEIQLLESRQLYLKSELAQCQARLLFLKKTNWQQLAQYK